jgi:hypothetical protein
MGDRSLLNTLTYRALGFGAIVLLTAAGAMAQDQTPHPWRTAPDAPPADQPQPYSSQQTNPAPAPPNYSSYPSFPNSPQGGQLPDPSTPLPGSGAAPAPQMAAVPPHLTIRPGTFVTIRVNQRISSDHNQQGDTFFATLAEPIIVDGVVVAQRGETVTGRVTEAQKAGRVEGTSRLGVELTGISLVDGQQLPVQSQMINRNGQTSVGRDAGAVATTTALGAAIGAGADWGRGAAIGAGAGAAAGLIGVLLTRGRPTEIYPESLLTFRLQAPVEIATDRAPQAFHYASNRDYGADGYAQRPAPGYAGAPVLVAPRPYYGPAYYPYPYYYGGPGFSVFVGSGYYGGFGRGRWR